MKNVDMFVVLAAAMVVMCGCGPAAKKEAAAPEEESAAETKARLQMDAKRMIPEVCSNYVTGITRVVEVRVSDLSENAGQWTGEAVAEYVNRMGGIERTNLPLKFSTYGDFTSGARQLSVIVDQHAIAAREAEAFRKKMERLRAGPN